jgi:hypothetical protein
MIELRELYRRSDFFRHYLVDDIQDIKMNYNFLSNTKVAIYPPSPVSCAPLIYDYQDPELFRFFSAFTGFQDYKIRNYLHYDKVAYLQDVRLENIELIPFEDKLTAATFDISDRFGNYMKGGTIARINPEYFIGKTPELINKKLGIANLDQTKVNLAFQTLDENKKIPYHSSIRKDQTSSTKDISRGKYLFVYHIEIARYGRDDDDDNNGDGGDDDSPGPHSPYDPFLSRFTEEERMEVYLRFFERYFPELLTEEAEMIPQIMNH